MMQKVEICGVNTSGLPKLTQKESEELMKRLKEGDEEAREQFVVGNMRLVLSLVKRVWAKRANADDVFQEVFLRYARKAPAFESEEHRRAWLLRVTVNCCRKAHTSLWRKRTEPLSETMSYSQPDGDSGFFDLLRLLPAKYRAVIHLFYYEGYSAREIGAMLRRKPATVRSQLARGRDILRRQLED